MNQQVARLPITPSTVKKLFAYSGNQCAMPDCTNTLVDVSGTMVGKMAHIIGAEELGPRFDPNLSNEQRRHFDNLFIVCGRHHDIIDDPANEASYPPAELRKYKAAHEGRFKSAERQLIKQFSDSTQATQPTYPTHLKALAQTVGADEMIGSAEELEGLRDFVDDLKELPLTERQFCLKVAERMRRQKRAKLLVNDVMSSFNLSEDALKAHLLILEQHCIGGWEEDFEPGIYYVKLADRAPGLNPWLEILDFCDATGATAEEFVFDLNFGLYDG